MNHRSNSVLLVAAFSLAAPAAAQTISAPYDVDYSFTDLGGVAGVPSNLGGITFLAGDPDTILLGGAANGSSGAIYSVPVTRDAQGQITALGAGTLFATAPNIDGGLTYGPGNVLFATGYSNNTLLQYATGSTAPDSTTVLSAFGITGSVGTCLFVPPGFPGVGQFKVASYSGQTWHTVDLVANATGTYDVVAASPGLVIGGGPEGILYPPPGSPQLPDFATVLISEYGNGVIAVYDLDANGDPVVGTRRAFMTGLSGAEGSVVDPVTGDMLFSTFGGGNRVIRVSGFGACGFYQAYGQGCGGSNGIPQLAGQTCPTPGAAIAIDVTSGPVNGMGQLALGCSQLNLSVLNCTLLVEQEASVGLILDGAGAFSYGVTIPNMPAFQGWDGYWQGAFFDASAPFGVVATSGLRMFVQ